MIPEKCVSTNTDSNVKIDDRKSQSAVFSNPERAALRLIRFDGCVVTDATACDWVVEKPSVGQVFVELKGSDVDHAAKQIECSIERMRQMRSLSSKVAGLIVCTRYPSIDTKIQRIKQRLAKRFRAPLAVKTHAKDLDIESLLEF